ncbi:hypothetical protein AAFF_G00241810 [Aldrovandia affinis]|uniref:Uncharacterized protein n=1 Tax=Aldrovandia affinis TaxID=143900 RepID=A0AAD7SUZ5_9TELE|nr:hypothetical protein AAFF_G00241810 [Aldrovandia affinis]
MRLELRRDAWGPCTMEALSGSGRRDSLLTQSSGWFPGEHMQRTVAAQPFSFGKAWNIEVGSRYRHRTFLARLAHNILTDFLTERWALMRKLDQGKLGGTLYLNLQLKQCTYDYAFAIVSTVSAEAEEE